MVVISFLHHVNAIHNWTSSMGVWEICVDRWGVWLANKRTGTPIHLPTYLLHLSPYLAIHISISFCQLFCLSIYPSAHLILSINPWTYLPISIYQLVYLYIHFCSPVSLSTLSIYSFIYFIHLTYLYLSTYLPIFLPTYIPIYLRTYLPIYLSIDITIYLPLYIYSSIHRPCTIINSSLFFHIHLLILLALFLRIRYI